MKHFLNSVTKSPAGSLHGRIARMAWPTGIAGVIAVSALACSENAPTTPISMGGSGGQVSAGGASAGTGIIAGTSNTPTAGTAPATSGAGGMLGTSGSASGGTGGGGTAGGTAGGSGGGTTGGSAGAGGSGGGSGGASDDGFVNLLNGKNLDGWTPGKNSSAFFAAAKLDGEDVIHVYPTQAGGSTQGEGTLRTNESYSSYVFRLEYKWGTKRFAPRAAEDRDNGICFHLVPPFDQVWPTSVELQLGSQAWPGDWVSGNIFMLINKTRAQWPYTTMNGTQVWSPTGTKRKIGAPTSYELGRVPSPNLNLDGGKNDPAATRWNTVELTVHGSKDAEYKVNGTVVNGLTDMEYDTGGGTFAPLDKGPIAIQAEYAETYFRNIKIKVLPP
jgi:hypothetical protein